MTRAIAASYPPSQIREIPYALIDRQIEQKFHWLSVIWILALYAIGVFFWGNFLNWGKTPLDFEDWGVINSPRFDFMQDALRSGQLPLHMKYENFHDQDHPLHGVTDRFLSMPDVITTPQTLLLAGVGISTFIYFDLLIHFTIATLGLLWFRRKYNLSLLAYGILFLLFHFNGYIQSHYGIGHITWAGYFLFPWFIVLVIQFVEGEQNWMWVAKVAGLLFYMVLAGSEHHFTWALIFLGVFGLVCYDKIKWILAAGLCAGLLSAVRLLPPLLIVQAIQSTSVHKLLVGYPTLLDLGRSMVTLVPSANLNFVASGVDWLGYWEFDIYVGLTGAAFIIFFGIFSWLRQVRLFPTFQKLIAPLLVVFLLSVGKYYSSTRVLRIPLFDGERAPSRMIGLPLTILILIAVIYFQNWLDEKRISQHLALGVSVVMLILLGNDLWTHSRSWKLEAIRAAFGPAKITLSGSSVTNHFDKLYFILIILGMLCSMLTGVFLFLHVRQEQSRREKRMVITV